MTANGDGVLYESSVKANLTTWLSLLVLLLSGCASTNKYSAADLPPELVAPPIDNPQTVDLSRLAMDQPGSQLVARGDVLEVTISAGLNSDDTFTFPVRVNERGYADLPVIGNIPLAGLELEGAEAAIMATCIQKQLYLSPHVTVMMKRQRMNRVTVIGAVVKQGIYYLPRQASDLVAALVAAGGLAEDAGTEIEIRQPSGARWNSPASAQNRIAIDSSSGVSKISHSISNASNTGPRVIRVNLVEASREMTKGYYIEDGGIVMVEKRDPMPIHVLGLVRRPGRHEYPVAEELRLLDAIALAEGVSSLVADKVFVIRKLKDQKEPVVIQTSLRKAKRIGKYNLRLTPGDVVSVEQTPGTVVYEAIQMMNVGIGASLGTFGLF